MNDKHLKKIVTGVLIYFISFVIVTYITFYIKGSIPDTLVQFGLGGGAVELFSTALIQMWKKKYEKDNGLTQDDIELFDADLNEHNTEE